MSDKENVSRETSRPDINQIMDAGQPIIPEQSGSGAKKAQEAAHQDTPQEAAPQNEQKGAGRPRKGASVFTYLAILFAAAFLMLLLAYFVQQRNSADAIDDLRTSMTATREELMEQNRQLQEERDGLEAQRGELQTELDELKKEFEQAKIQLDVYMEIAGGAKLAEDENQCWTEFWAMEENFLQEDYEACAEYFRDWYGSNYYITPEAAVWRAEEIYNELIQLGYLTEDEPARW